MRTLLLRPGAIGDLIVSLPAMEYLRSEFTEVWAPSANLPLIRFADRTRSVVRLDMLASRVVEELQSFNRIFSWYGTAQPAFREALRGLPITFFDALPPPSGLHATDYYADQVGLRAGCIPKLLSGRPGSDIVIHPFSGSAKKNWPLDRFKHVAEALGPSVRWCAGPEEPLANAERFDDLWELALWLSTAKLYIGNDSGITHLAAACGCPVIALFGASDPAVWAPRGPNVRVLQAASLHEISEEAVLRLC